MNCNNNYNNLYVPPNLCSNVAHFSFNFRNKKSLTSCKCNMGGIRKNNMIQQFQLSQCVLLLSQQKSAEHKLHASVKLGTEACRIKGRYSILA